MRLLPILALASCVAPTGERAERAYDVAGELEGDHPSWLVAAEAGESYSATLTTCHPSEAHPSLGCMAVYSLEVAAGDNVVVVVRSRSHLRPELLVKAYDHTLVAYATEQTLYPHLPADDPFTVLDEGTYFVFVSGEGYASSGEYEVSFATLERPLAFPLATDDSTVGILTDDLRDLDARPNRDRLLERGDGYVAVARQPGVPLEERVALLRLEHEINETREAIFGLLARRAERWVDGETLRIVGGDWVMLREALDALP